MINLAFLISIYIKLINMLCLIIFNKKEEEYKECFKSRYTEKQHHCVIDILAKGFSSIQIKNFKKIPIIIK
ncbi:hypothetical protein BpHYR1_053953 [Brachionus plicatilis]|uniref:Uncharacterized protein n=1 Tax=Brachionus plicatilis TaxID=10195 RepID=A0A3M7SS56_BRAPC|nr:hypothetical protein BpHYR1_053953 [Brachionus plicatilis]